MVTDLFREHLNNLPRPFVKILRFSCLFLNTRKIRGRDNIELDIFISITYFIDFPSSERHRPEICQYLLADNDKNKGEGREEIASIVQKHQLMLLKTGKSKKQRHVFFCVTRMPLWNAKCTTLWVRNVESATDLTVKPRHINFK